MKALMIGGSGFIGRFVVSKLQESGHAVTIFHRGSAAPLPGVEQIQGDRKHLREYRREFQNRNFDVVIDMILSSGEQATDLMEIFRGLAGRVVAPSSMDVYRAWGIFYGLETGVLQPMPVTEESDLRSKPVAYPPEMLQRVQQIFPWMTEAYDKIAVENAVLGAHDPAGTVLRLPMVYGPNDPLHRLHFLLKRIDDGRKYILFADDVAALRTPRGYVENVAHAIFLAAVSGQAAGRIYNVAEQTAFSELEWAGKAAEIAGWKGEFVVLPHDRTPKHLWMPGNTAQHLVGSSDRIRNELGYLEPISLEESLRRTIEWERRHPPQNPMAVFDYQAEDAAVSAFKAGQSG
jgi:nucleoside-diphosphate-sugar epimerase